jgi:galactose mutarotase-like enzyme
VLTLASPALTVELEPARGAEIRVVAGTGGRNVLAAYDWEAPVPAWRSASYGSSMLDWLSAYRGGWQELFPNAGPECEVDGVPLPFHGEASVSAWEVVERAQDRVTLRVGARLPLVLERRMSLAGTAPVLRIHERAVNVGDAPVRFAWGHHPAFALRPGSRVDVPGASLAIEPAERLDCMPLEQGWAALRDGSTGVALAWDAATFPHLWLWTEVGGAGFPFYGRARSIGIEPQSTSSLDGFARGEGHVLAPGAACEAWLTLALFDADERAVEGVERDGSVRRAPAATR